MVRRREVREEERELWDHVTRDVRKPRARKAVEPVAKSKPAKTPRVSEPRPVSQRAVEPAAPMRRQVAPFGVDGSTAERLRRGKIEPDATVDLHGMTQAQAHARLTAFVRQGHELGNRCVLVITGKGVPKLREESVRGFVMPERSKSGVLRDLVPRWLEELRAIVVGVQKAHQKHGGGGAYYVYLRRKRGAQ